MISLGIASITFTIEVFGRLRGIRMFAQTVKSSALIVILGLISACASQINIEEAAPAQDVIQDKQYYIGAGDSLNVNVWRNEELTMTIPVRPDGKISMPLIGDVQAAGLSASQLSTELQSKLVNFIRNPQVTVIVASADSSGYQNRVRITGAINTPLSLPYRDGMTILDLVLESGGLTEFANGNNAKLFRKSEDGVKAYKVRLLDILNKGNLATNYELAPSDIVTVPERLF